jgi:hypothetical protein
MSGVLYKGIGTAPASLTQAPASTCVVPYPTGIVAGDTLVLCVADSAPTTVSTPSGWTSAKTALSVNGDLSSYVFVKNAAGTETGNLTVSMGASSVAIGVMLRYSGGPGTSNAAAFGGTASATQNTGTSSPAAGTLSTAPAAVDQVVRFYTASQITQSSSGTITAAVPGNWNTRASIITKNTSTYNVAVVAADQFDAVDNQTITSQSSAWAVIDIVIKAATPATPYPATNLNIGATGGQNHFLLQTAFAGDTNIYNVTEASLVAGYSVNPQFIATADGKGAQMMVNVAAPTTDGSSFPRTECRELSTDGVTNMTFNPQTGTHYMRGRTKITNLTTTKPTVVFAQCHNASSDIIALCTQLNTGTGNVQAIIRINGTSSGTPKMSTIYSANDEFDWMIQFTNSGYWAVYYQDLGTPFYDSVAHAALNPSNPIVYTGAADCYFKCGCYANTNTASEAGDATQFMELELRYLSHWHTGWTTPATITLPTPAQFAPFFG